MQIGGYRVRQHLRLLAPMFALLAAVWAVRWISSSLGAPHWFVHAMSITVATPITVLLAVLLIHNRRFGGYVNVVVSSLLLNIWAELLVVAGILFSVLTGTPNVFTASEYTPPGVDPMHLKHMRGHLTFGIGIGTLAGAAMGCLLLALLRRLFPPRPAGRDAAENRWPL